MSVKITYLIILGTIFVYTDGRSPAGHRRGPSGASAIFSTSIYHVTSYFLFAPNVFPASPSDGCVLTKMDANYCLQDAGCLINWYNTLLVVDIMCKVKTAPRSKGLP